jgi:hypothetical protein
MKWSWRKSDLPISHEMKRKKVRGTDFGISRFEPRRPTENFDAIISKQTWAKSFKWGRLGTGRQSDHTSTALRVPPLYALLWHLVTSGLVRFLLRGENTTVWMHPGHVFQDAALSLLLQYFWFSYSHHLRQLYAQLPTHKDYDRYHVEENGEKKMRTGFCFVAHTCKIR